MKENRVELHLFAGVHRSGHEHLRAQLEHNSDLLAAHGTIIPPMDLAEKAIWGAIKAIRKGNATDQTGANLIEQLSGGKACKRILVIRPSMSGTPIRPTKNGILYPRGSATIAQFMRGLPDIDVRLFFATSNPATFLPACYNLAFMKNRDLTFAEFVQQSNPFDLRWSEYLHRVQGKESETPLTIWSYEEYPFVWRSVAQAFSGLPNKEDIAETPASFDLGMSLKGINLMRTYLIDHPVDNATQLEKIRVKFEERFPPIQGETLDDVWPQEVVTQLTDAYDDDNYYIDRMDNVTAIRKPVYA